MLWWERDLEYPFPPPRLLQARHKLFSGWDPHSGETDPPKLYYDLHTMTHMHNTPPNVIQGVNKNNGIWGRFKLPVKQDIQHKGRRQSIEGTVVLTAVSPAHKPRVFRSKLADPGERDIPASSKKASRNWLTDNNCFPALLAPVGFCLDALSVPAGRQVQLQVYLRIHWDGFAPFYHRRTSFKRSS